MCELRHPSALVHFLLLISQLTDAGHITPSVDMVQDVSNYLCFVDEEKLAGNYLASECRLFGRNRRNGSGERDAESASIESAAHSQTGH